MKMIEILFWNCAYFAAYLSISLTLYFITGNGDIFGILLIGVMCCAVLTIYLSFQDDWLFETWEPAIVHSTKTITSEVEPNEEIKKSEVVFEPTPKIRTDVDLRMLDADDDDILG